MHEPAFKVHNSYCIDITGSGSVRISNPWVPKEFFTNGRGLYDLKIEKGVKCSSFYIFFADKFLFMVFV